MPLPNMNYTNSPAGYNLQTSSGPSFSSSRMGGEGGMGEMEGIFQEMSRRKAAAVAEEKRRWDIENERAEELQRNLQRAQNAPRPQMGGGRPQAPVSELRMGPQGQWYDYIDPQKAELFNTGKVLPGRTGSPTSQFSADDYRNMRLDV